MSRQPLPWRMIEGQGAIGLSASHVKTYLVAKRRRHRVQCSRHVDASTGASRETSSILTHNHDQVAKGGGKGGQRLGLQTRLYVERWTVRVCPTNDLRSS